MTTTATSTAFRRWVERIESGTFTHSEARQWAQAVAMLCAGRDARGHRTNLTTEEARRLWDLLFFRPDGVSLTAEHAAKGERWLKEYGADRLGIPAELLPLFERFTFHGEAEIDRNNAYPIWRVHLTDGRRFDYFAPPWQATAYAHGTGRTSAQAVGAVWWWVE